MSIIRPQITSLVRGNARGLVGGGGATLTPFLCNDPAESPRVWVQIKKLKDDGTDAALTRTASFNLPIDLPSGSLVKWTQTGSGSPLPSITMTVRGVCRGVA